MYKNSETICIPSPKYSHLNNNAFISCYVPVHLLNSGIKYGTGTGYHICTQGPRKLGFKKCPKMMVVPPCLDPAGRVAGILHYRQGTRHTSQVRL